MLLFKIVVVSDVLRSFVTHFKEIDFDDNYVFRRHLCYLVLVLFRFYFFQGPLDISEYYLNFLFFIAVVWFLGFAVSAKWGKNKNDVKQPIKSHHASNRWLKGISTFLQRSFVIRSNHKACLKLFKLNLDKLPEVLNNFLKPFVW